jgi:RNA polymerase primary sigma factor
MNTAGRIPVLPPAQQLGLARQVRTWLDWPTDAGPCPSHIEARGRRAKKKLIETNVRLVVTIAHKHCSNTRAELADLIQEGCLGLNRAAELFDPTRGYQFSTYAYWWIRQTIARAAKDDRLIRVSEGAQSRWAQLSRLISEYESEHGFGCRPTLEWLSAQTGLNRDLIERSIVIGRVRTLASLDARAKASGGDATLGELIAAHSFEEAADAADDADHARERAELLQQLLSKLPEEDRALIRDLDLRGLRHGDLTAELGVGRSRIGQLHARARQRLQAIADQHLATA